MEQKITATPKTDLGFISGDNSWTHSGWAQDPRILSRIPSWISSRTLVFMSLIWAGLCVFAGVFEVGLMWGYICAAVAHLGHYITDSVDGALGRYREEGYVRWGFAMDHFLDTWVAASYFVCLYGSVGRLHSWEFFLSTFSLLSTFTMTHLRDIVRLNSPGEDGKPMTYSNDVAGISMVYVRYAIIAGCVILIGSSLLDEPWQIDITSGPWFCIVFVVIMLVVAIAAHVELGAQDMAAKKKKLDLEAGVTPITNEKQNSYI